jgi:2-polyprenyl-3-methyl-5-hydroxy-6-metoxy-1,4-benzoquinol methylase
MRRNVGKDSTEARRGRNHPGTTTGTPLNVEYRLGRILHLISGKWLDAGCAEGHYTSGLLSHGADEVYGVDLIEDRVAEARRTYPAIDFRVASTEQLPFPCAYFDGVWCNEVFEHVADEAAALREFRRVLKPEGALVLISPNRWFPFEGHQIMIRSLTIGHPTPFIPWLPRSLTQRWTSARNYWPVELRRKVRRAGFRLERPQFVMPVLEQYPWLPAIAVNVYQRRINLWHQIPGLRHFGVSNLVIAHPR